MRGCVDQAISKPKSLVLKTNQKSTENGAKRLSREVMETLQSGAKRGKFGGFHIKIKAPKMAPKRVIRRLIK